MPPDPRPSTLRFTLSRKARFALWCERWSPMLGYGVALLLVVALWWLGRQGTALARAAGYALSAVVLGYAIWRDLRSAGAWGGTMSSLAPLPVWDEVVDEPSDAPRVVDPADSPTSAPVVDLGVRVAEGADNRLYW